MQQLQTGNAGLVNVDSLPDRCPICLNRIQPIDYTQAMLTRNIIEKAFRCPAYDCQRVFVAYYKQVPGGTYVLAELFPSTIKKSEHSDVVKAVSPDFVTIFGEAEVAEKHGLKLVCGPGYRKALEFLIIESRII
jgi:hypothetical protein